MFTIRLICVGKLKEQFFISAASEYQKRLMSHCRLEIEEIPESRLPVNPSPSEIEGALLKEANGIRLRLPQGGLSLATCVEGKQLESVQFAQFIELCAVQGKSKLSFIIGGSNGLHSQIKQEADLKLSLSKMTFPHHLARIILLEQIYRAFKITEGAKYHK